MPWDLLSCFQYRYCCKVEPIRVDRFCFLNALELVLHCDCGGAVTLDDVVNTILEQLAASTDYYEQPHSGDIL